MGGPVESVVAAQPRWSTSSRHGELAGRVEMMFLETAEDDSRTNRVDASVDILVGLFGPSRPTITGASDRPDALGEHFRFKNQQEHCYVILSCKKERVLQCCIIIIIT